MTNTRRITKITAISTGGGIFPLFQTVSVVLEMRPVLICSSGFRGYGRLLSGVHFPQRRRCRVARCAEAGCKVKHMRQAVQKFEEHIQIAFLTAFPGFLFSFPGQPPCPVFYSTSVPATPFLSRPLSS